MGLLGWIKESFIEKNAEPDVPHPVQGYPEDSKPVKNTGQMYKRIALVVGHTKSAQGAITYPVNGVNIREYEWNTQRAIEAKAYIDTNHPGKEVRIFYRDGIGRDGVAKMIGKWKADLSLELHFNSIGLDKDAFGSEMLILAGDDISAEIGNNLVEELSRQFKTKLRGRYTTKVKKDYRGIKALIPGDRGYENLSYLAVEGVPIKLLIEPFFAGTKTEESKQFLEDPKKYSRVLGMFLGQLP